MSPSADSGPDAAPPASDNAGSDTLTLPSSWFTDDKIYALERRGLFGRNWLYATHKSRFQEPGDYMLFEIAGYSFFIIMGTDNTLRAFHNVCRHRAFPVVKKQSGSALVLGCKYHGWSYNATGALTKAPQFENVPGFDPSQNGLYPIAVHVTEPGGFVFVNMDNGKNGEPVQFKDWFGDMESAHLGDGMVNFEDYKFHMEYTMEGDFNWKTLMDGYQECYHCPVAHPGLAKDYNTATYTVTNGSHYSRHRCDRSEAEKAKAAPAPAAASSEPVSALGGLMRTFGFGSSGQKADEKKEVPAESSGDMDGLWLYLWPNTGLNCYSTCFYTIRVNPLTAKRTRLEYEIYANKNASKAEVDSFVEFFKKLEQEDFDLCEATQKNLEKGIYSKGVLHPVKETGVVYYQGEVRRVLEEWAGKEKEKGREIFGAGFAVEDEEGDGWCR
ncbi:putative phenylpropionate dioxygenase [Hyaloraphidium curvatum]|nr:putative phenylpropionate dioxygenase [Hyaloraphidium curvatum]